MSVTNRAGRTARTDRDDSHAQNSSGTTCDGCDHRDAEGIDAAGRSLCRPCARRAETLVADGGVDVETVEDVDGGEDESEFLPNVPRTYERLERCRVKPAIVETDEKLYKVDHLDRTPEVVRCVNFDADGDVDEVVSFPWHRVQSIEHYPAEEAIDESPFEARAPLDRSGADE